MGDLDCAGVSVLLVLVGFLGESVGVSVFDLSAVPVVFLPLLPIVAVVDDNDEGEALVDACEEAPGAAASP